MIEGNDIDAPNPMDNMAAEFVLGTLDAAERAEVDRRRLTEPELDAAILAWEARLAGLLVNVTPIAPPAELKAKVLARVLDRATARGADRVVDDVPGQPAPWSAVPRREDRLGADDPATAPSAVELQAEVIDLRRRVARWRGATAGLAALAATLAGVVVVRDTLRTVPTVPPAKPQPVAAAPAQQTFVAVLHKDEATPAFLMTVDLDKRIFTVRPVAPKVPAGKSFELWIVTDRIGKPRSLGLLADRPKSGVSLAAFDPNDIQTATFAVSIEPEGGSPVDGPTGPVLYHGKLVPFAGP
jgi:anti-sigma-K factor RskA